MSEEEEAAGRGRWLQDDHLAVGVVVWNNLLSLLAAGRKGSRCYCQLK